MNLELPLESAPVVAASSDSFADLPFVGAYQKLLDDSGALARYAESDSTANAEALTMAMYDAIHDAAPEDARFAIMTSFGKDSSAATHFYVESVEARVAAGKRFVPATFFTSNVGHEFSDMENRQVKESAALNRWGEKYGISVVVVKPPARDTVLVELIGNGFALPPKATNDKVTAASVSNWCVDRVKRKLLDKATKEAAACAPVVIQVFGSRYDESDSRAFRMKKYSAGLPAGLTRVAMSDAKSSNLVLGLYAIGHYSDRQIRDFVHNKITTYRGIEGNLELEKIYRDASKDGAEAGECSIQRTKDGGFAGGCSSLATGTRMGCFICLKATNTALRNLAEKYPVKYARTYRVQQEINEHQERVHSRPKSVVASGFTGDNMFPKGFQFIQRYRWLVMILAAEMESGERQLTDEQLTWIERRWRRHGVVTVSVADAKKDAALWLKIGGDEPPVFFRNFTSHAGDFTHSLGEGLPIGAYAANSDEDQADLNLAHMMGMGVTGGPLFPDLRAYVFDDVETPLDRFVMVTDTPSIIGTNTNTGLLNGSVGASLRCIGVRTPTDWERKMADGRHLFYRYSKKEIAHFLTVDSIGDTLSAARGIMDWTLGDFPKGRNPRAGTEAHEQWEWLLKSVRAGFITTALERQNLVECGLDLDPIRESFYTSASITQLAGNLTDQDLRQAFTVVENLVGLSESLQDLTASAHRELVQFIRDRVSGDWTLLRQDNAAGSALRSELRKRLKSSMFSEPAIKALFAEYIDAVKALAVMSTDGKMNTSLAVRIAYILRVDAICPKDTHEYLDELVRWLKITKAVDLPKAA